MSTFERACELCGGQTRLAALMSDLSGERYTQQRVSNWRKTGIPTESILHVCMATGWQVTPHELRPDIYPNPDDALPVEMRKAAA